MTETNELDELKIKYEELQAENKRLMATLSNAVRTQGLNQAFLSSGAKQSMMLAVEAISEKQVEVDGEYHPAVSVDAQGRTKFRDLATGLELRTSSGQLFDYSHWLKHLSEAHGLELFQQDSTPTHENPTAPRRPVSGNPYEAEKPNLTDIGSLMLTNPKKAEALARAAGKDPRTGRPI